MGLSINVKPIIGDFVACFFPYEENLSIPGPTLRPALIVDISDENIVFVAYCSAAKSSYTTKAQPMEKWQIEIHPSQINGFSEITRVDFIKITPIPWTYEWFGINNNKKSILLGKLDPSHRSTANTAKQEAKNFITNHPHKEYAKKNEIKNKVIVEHRKPKRKPPTDDLSDVT